MRQSEEYITDKEPRLKNARMALSAVGFTAAIGFGIAGINHAIWQGRNDQKANGYTSLEAQMPSVDPLSEDANDQEQLIKYYETEESKYKYMALADGQAAAKDGDFAWAASSFTAAIITSASIIYKKVMAAVDERPLP